MGTLPLAWMSFLRAAATSAFLFLAAPPLLFLLCVLLYFPSAPPSPPSESAQLERVALVPSTRRLLANRQTGAELSNNQI